MRTRIQRAGLRKFFRRHQLGEIPRIHRLMACGLFEEETDDDIGGFDHCQAGSEFFPILVYPALDFLA